ncbi:hypothetical protein [Streptomyces sp. cg35]|uniref:hypothetical protein n=1 Tax=Streptomyces sp. cg35 TaxID=3421650 RepID=UPI003D173791
MTVITAARRALATASAYLRINMTTGLTDVLCGTQVDFLLVDIYRDDDVQPGPRGRYQVVTGDGTMIRFAPLAAGPMPLVPWYQHCLQPDGRTSHQVAPVTADKLAKALPKAAGSVHTLADGALVRLYRGRCAETWTPLAEAPDAAS